MKIISFSLYGTESKYTIGAIENAKIQPLIYPDWKCRFYYDNSVHKDIIKKLKDLGSETIEINNWKGNDRRIWRFLVASDISVERYIIRDSDSRINIREKESVEKWMKTNYLFHLIKDHPHHYHHEYPMFAGMWGGVSQSVPEISKYTEEWLKKEHIDNCWNDAIFINTYIWKKAEKNLLLHTSSDILTKLSLNMFVGQQFDENNNPIFP